MTHNENQAALDLNPIAHRMIEPKVEASHKSETAQASAKKLMERPDKLRGRMVQIMKILKTV